MKKYIYINICATALLLASCQSEELIHQTEGEGYIQLSSIEIDKNVQTRATDEIMGVKIIAADGTVYKQTDDWTELQGVNFLVPAGTTYTIEAYSASKNESQGFDAEPYYSGKEELTVKANTAHNVEIVCKLSQSMVTVSYSDNFKKHFSWDDSRVIVFDVVLREFAVISLYLSFQKIGG